MRRHKTLEINLAMDVLEAILIATELEEDTHDIEVLEDHLLGSLELVALMPGYEAIEKKLAIDVLSRVLKYLEHYKEETGNLTIHDVLLKSHVNGQMEWLMSFLNFEQVKEA